MSKKCCTFATVFSGRKQSVGTTKLNNQNYSHKQYHWRHWIRPDTLVKHDLFAGTDIKQIIGHSQTGAGITKDYNIICVDCLGTRERSYIIEV